MLWRVSPGAEPFNHHASPAAAQMGGQSSILAGLSAHRRLSLALIVHRGSCAKTSWPMRTAPPLKCPTAASASSCSWRASPTAALTRPHSTPPFRSFALSSMPQPLPLPAASNSSFEMPPSLQPKPSGVANMLILTFTIGISAVPSAVRPTTFAAFPSLASAGPEAMPSSRAACQLITEYIELVSIMPSSGKDFCLWRTWTGKPSRLPGSARHGRDTAPTFACGLLQVVWAVTATAPAFLSLCSPRARSRSRS
mmetsp:Transcript_90863/g.236725  ORF Transcript_90863/g.236725 Transcript_90863/m.236725 type:complete len:253 (-) Transcript_90863:941-1699(-)